MPILTLPCMGGRDMKFDSRRDTIKGTAIVVLMFAKYEIRVRTRTIVKKPKVKAVLFPGL